MVEPTEVWMVHLRTGDKPAEIRGTLSLDEDGLVFTERKTDAQLVFGFTTIERGKRIRGSPVLLVDWRTVRIRHALDILDSAVLDSFRPLVFRQCPTSKLPFNCRGNWRIDENGLAVDSRDDSFPCAIALTGRPRICELIHAYGFDPFAR